MNEYSEACKCILLKHATAAASDKHNAFTYMIGFIPFIKLDSSDESAG